MNPLRVLLCVLLVALTIGLFLAPSRLAAAGVPIDPRVLEDTADGKVGNFLVLLKSQVRGRTVAASMADRERRGRAVFDALRQNALATQPGARAQLVAFAAKYRAYSIANVIAVEGTRAVVDAMSAREDVAKIESDRAFRVNLEQSQRVALAPSAVEWNIAKVNAPQVWAKGYTGQGRVYANADTGVQWDHPALKPHYRGWNGVSADHNYNWWDAVHYDINGGGNPCGGFSLPSPCDDYGHGTHTMGTGIGDDGAGNQIGMAPGAKWIACRNMDQGVGRPSTYIECMEFFLAPWDQSGNNPDPSKRPDAVGNSYTCPPSELCSTDSLQIATDNLRAAGVFMSLSAGNEGPSCSTISEPPSFYDSGITVGATDSSDNIASFSSRGPITIDGSNRRKPDLVAPGVLVRSSYPVNTYYTYIPGGTSMASPHVAGAVVLLWSRFPQIARDVDTTESILEQNAVHLYASSPFCGTDNGSSMPNNVYGYGRLDVLAAYNYADSVYFPLKYLFPLIFR